MPSPITLSASFILIGLTIYIFDWVRRTFRTIVAEEDRAWGDWPHIHDELPAAANGGGGTAAQGDSRDGQGTSLTHSGGAQ